MRRPMVDDNMCRLGYCVDMSRRLVDQYASIICIFFAANFAVAHTALLAVKKKWCGGSSCLPACESVATASVANDKTEGKEGHG